MEGRGGIGRGGWEGTRGEEARGREAERPGGGLLHRLRGMDPGLSVFASNFRILPSPRKIASPQQ
jgi:hypothetical protein